MPQGPIDDIDREAVESSNIRAIGYSNAKQTLAVEFKGGDVFHYAPVPVELATEFYGSESKGKFYSARIKGKIPARCMTGPCQECGIIGETGTRCTECGCGNHVDRERRPLTEREQALEREALTEQLAHGEVDPRD